MTSVGELRRRVEVGRAYEKEREKVIEDLLSSLESVTANLERAELDLENEVATRRQQQRQIIDLSSKLTARPYVVVLIDADADDYIFRRIGEGARGGDKAADELYAQVKRKLRDRVENIEQCKVFVEAYANLEGLGRSLIEKHQVRSVDELRLFWHGFVCCQPHFSFVDVGYGKERADHKLRESVTFHCTSWQCKHILLGCCHDSGYAPFLSQFASEEKIMLLESGLCHAAFKSLRVPRIQFTELFMGQLIFDVGAGSNRARTGVVSVNTAWEQKKSLINPYALQQRLNQVKIDPQSKLRYDIPLDVEESVVEKMNTMKLCHWYFLIGECKLKGCKMGHNDLKLTPLQFDALWSSARKGECKKSRGRKLCENKLCIYGHPVKNQTGSG